MLMSSKSVLIKRVNTKKHLKKKLIDNNVHAHEKLNDLKSKIEKNDYKK